MSAPTLKRQDPGSQSPGLAAFGQSRILDPKLQMMLPQIIPALFTFLAAYLPGGPFTRLHLLAVLFAKPLVALVLAALLLFIVSRSADICRSLLLGPSFWITWSIIPNLRHRVPIQLIVDNLPAPPPLDPLFQRPPPSLSR